MRRETADGGTEASFYRRWTGSLPHRLFLALAESSEHRNLETEGVQRAHPARKLKVSKCPAAMPWGPQCVRSDVDVVEPLTW